VLAEGINKALFCKLKILHLTGMHEISPAYRPSLLKVVGGVIIMVPLFCDGKLL
jgi:hypothetical protein